MRFADRPMSGGRDVNFPELVGEPHGPDADYDLDLDVDGLAGIEDRSVDAVVLSHVIEHVANPIHALEECARVLRPAGRLVLIVPLRHATFDALRPGTSLAHLLAEHQAGVTEVDVEHIREFCHSVYHHTPNEPSETLEWHNPDRLDDDLVALHRRRSIHVHCWDAEEMAVAARRLGRRRSRRVPPRRPLLRRRSRCRRDRVRARPRAAVPGPDDRGGVHRRVGRRCAPG